MKYTERVDALAAGYADIETRSSVSILDELVAVSERSKRAEDAVQRALVISILSGELLRRAELGVAFGKGRDN